ncbi:DUF4180 domain-containing protein [Streptomyces sp. SP18CS02]|uniref:DUF4180 domain-containing protein n=1 Tax=Streptomyces sp. SP18CS02 TaxID=3002531 RepID=UPI002E76A79A|nr:DUF4180 domain-containing protein [Streptomyces sp. SP18CS02]MEE1754933.1 DUF4180 domain-containing protein [Streptomyces sp. SP18CS02]
MPAWVWASHGPSLSGRRSALDLIGEAGGRGAELVVVPVERVADAFFSPRTGMAQEVERSFAGHGMRLAIVGDVSRHMTGSPSLSDFVRERDRGGRLWFAPTFPALAERLARGSAP